MTKRIIKLVSLLSVLFILAACGQKGPLYIPPERETTDAEAERTETAVEQVQPATEDSPGAG